MKPSSSSAIEKLLQQHVLPLFALSDSDVVWQGDSELDTQGYVYYFCIDSINYLLVREPHHGAGDDMLANIITSNAIAPHQKVVPITPLESVRSYVNVSKQVPQLTGDFSLFRIIN